MKERSPKKRYGVMLDRHHVHRVHPGHPVFSVCGTGHSLSCRADANLVTSDSARLFYRVIGRGADTLIAIHGGPGVDLESIAADFAPLGERHVVIFYDQRGAGRSELPRDTTRLIVSRQIADLDDVRRHFNLRHAPLVAHS